MARVDACPQNLTAATEASKRLGCGHDEYGNSQYLCLPNANLTFLVEFCYKGIMGLQENGSCLQASERNLILTSCVKFTSGCPKVHYMSSEFYKYSACQNVNLKHHCYVMDPFCQPNTTEKPSDNLAIHVVTGGLIALVTFVLFCALLYHQRKKLKRSKGGNEIDEEVDYKARNGTCNEFTHDTELNEEQILHDTEERMDGSKGSQKCEETKEKKNVLEKLTDDTLKEMRSLLADKTEADVVMKNVLAIKECIDTNNAVEDVFTNIKRVLKLGKIITDNLNLSVLEWRATCSFLSTVMQESEFSLQKINTLANQRSTYTEIFKKTEGIRMWNSAVGFEANLLHSNNYLTHMKDDASKHLIDSLQNYISEQEIVNFLTTLHSEAVTLILKSEVESARLASEIVNVYFGIATLHLFVLWQVLCIKIRSGFDESSTQGVFSIVKSCQTSALNLLEFIAHPKAENALFLSVFHITDNENVLHFLHIQDIEPVVFDESFLAQSHFIQRVSKPCLKLHMKPRHYGIYGTYETTDGCKFNFEPVPGRELDNVCYIRSAHCEWKKYYIQMNSKGSCAAVSVRPETGGKWKFVPLVTDKEHQTFIISSIDWPGLFLYLGSYTGYVSGKDDLEKVKEKGLWKICNL